MHCDTLTRAIVDNPPTVLREGGVMKQGFDAELDELLDLSQNSSRFLIEYETKEREQHRNCHTQWALTACMAFI